MKTNFKSLLLCGLAVLCMTAMSCSSDPGEGGEGIDTPTSSEYSYFSLRVRGAASTGTRAAATHEGAAKESQINSMYILLYNNSGLLEYRFEPQIQTDGTAFTESGGLYGASNTVRVFQTLAQKVKTQDYQLVVVLNPNDKINAVTFSLENTLADFKEAGDLENDGVSYLIGNDQDDFLMSNWQDAVAVSTSMIYGTEDEAHAAPVNVYLDRAVAKIAVVVPQRIANRAYNDYSSFEVTHWTVDVINNRTYWMRQPWLTCEGTTESGDREDRDLNYAKDMNFDQWHSFEAWTALSGVAPAPASPNPDFLFLPGTDKDTNVSSWAAQGGNNSGLVNDDWDFIYVPENTMAANQQYRDVTTSVILRVLFHPNRSALQTEDANDIAENAPYFAYYYNNERYVFLAQQLEDEFLYQDNNNGQSQVYDNPTVQTFMDDISAYRTLLESGSGAVSFTDYASANDSGNLAGDFVFFDGSHVNFYRIPVRHFNDDQQPEKMAYGRFGMVRNNLYLVSINNIFSPGAASINDPDKPGPEDPKGPDETIDSYISTTIEILPWVVRSQEVHAGE